jgi:histidyl-tRNA synthetase
MGELSETLKEKEGLIEIFAKALRENSVEPFGEHCLDHDSKRNLDTLLSMLQERGVTNTKLDLSIMRGFDYYTGIVFEVFDTHPDNTRSIFGGGRYDDLLAIFGQERLPAVGFGMGDVSLRNFLETHELLPNTHAHTDLYICTLDRSAERYADEVASSLRKHEIKVAVDHSLRKPGDQIKTASNKNIPYVLCIGENEMTSKTGELKHLPTGEVTAVNIDDISSIINA